VERREGRREGQRGGRGWQWGRVGEGSRVVMVRGVLGGGRIGIIFLYFLGNSGYSANISYK
jgi:hypothetical protein